MKRQQPLALRRPLNADDQRNINPHAEARLSIALWGHEYSRQPLGCMQWWDQLPDRRKSLVRHLLDVIAELPRETVVSETPK